MLFSGSGKHHRSSATVSEAVHISTCIVLYPSLSETSFSKVFPRFTTQEIKQSESYILPKLPTQFQYYPVVFSSCLMNENLFQKILNSRNETGKILWHFLHFSLFKVLNINILKAGVCWSMIFNNI